MRLINNKSGVKGGIVMTVLLAAGFQFQSLAADRLWDKEPALWDVAQSYTLKRPLSAEFGVEGPAWNGKEPRGEGVGINLCNGKLKLCLWGTGDRLTITVSKTDIWNRFNTVMPYKKPGFWNKPFPKPAGQLALLAADFQGAAQPEVATAIRNGVNAFTLTNGPAKGEFAVLTTRSNSNIIAISARYDGLTNPVVVKLSRGLGEGTGEAGNDGKFFWIHYTLPAEKTFPQGFGFYFVGRVAGASSELSSKGTGAKATLEAAARIAPAAAGHVLIYATVVTVGETADPLAEAKRRLTDAENRGFAALAADNEAWFKALYERREIGRIFTGDFSSPIKDIILPFCYQGSWADRHCWYSNPDPARYEADALYVPIGGSSAPWSGLPCFNEELFTGDFVAGRNESVSPYYVALVNMWRPAWERHAQEDGYQGMYYIRGYVPNVKPDLYYSWDHWAMITNAAKDWHTMCFSYKIVWNEFDYGGHDDAFLRESVYPGLRNIADFFCSLVKMGSNGCYHINDALMCEGPAGADALDCIASAKWFWKTAILAANILQTDTDRRAKWQQFLDKIQPYYLMDDGTYGTLVQKGVLKQNKIVNHFPISISDEFNLDLPQAERDRAFNSCAQVGYLNADTGHLLAKNPDQWAGNSDRSRYQWMMYYAKKYVPSFTNEVTPGHLTALDTPLKKAAACWFEPERLCNSRSGTIYLYPCVPSKFDVAFKDMQARGGFLVSAELKNGAVTYASIKARRAGECKVMNPWPGKKLSVLDKTCRKNVEVCREKGGERHSFDAVAGHEYELLEGSP